MFLECFCVKVFQRILDYMETILRPWNNFKLAMIWSDLKMLEQLLPFLIFTPHNVFSSSQYLLFYFAALMATNLWNCCQRTSLWRSMTFCWMTSTWVTLSSKIGWHPHDQEFLNRKDLLSRGDFVDIGNLECTPKVKIPRSYLPLPSLACTRWRTQTSATSSTAVTPMEGSLRNCVRWEQ